MPGDNDIKRFIPILRSIEPLQQAVAAFKTATPV
jgi:hypothetical protein